MPVNVLLVCQQVNNALKTELKDIHALSIKKCWTLTQQAEAQKGA